MYDLVEADPDSSLACDLVFAAVLNLSLDLGLKANGFRYKDCWVGLWCSSRFRIWNMHAYPIEHPSHRMALNDNKGIEGKRCCLRANGGLSGHCGRLDPVNSHGVEGLQYSSRAKSLALALGSLWRVKNSRLCLGFRWHEIHGYQMRTRDREPKPGSFGAYYLPRAGSLEGSRDSQDLTCIRKGSTLSFPTSFWRNNGVDSILARDVNCRDTFLVKSATLANSYRNRQKHEIHKQHHFLYMLS